MTADTTETIFASATAAGPAGVAVVRVSGPETRQILGSVAGVVPAPRHAVLRALCNPDGQRIDKGLVLFFPAPHSYTGEDVAEFHVHGGRAVLDALVGTLSLHARLAEPGEFTRRAFENGKLDLTEAEAVADLIAAETEAQRVQALDQLEGALARLYQGWADRLTTALAHQEAEIEFPDEDMPQGIVNGLKEPLQEIAAEIAAHMDDARRGERLRNGFSITIMGAPNAGKSSLLNAIAARDIAIVSTQAGTTRDVIEAHLNLSGYPVIVADTAGLRAACDEVEREGMRRARLRAEQADLKIAVFDATNLPGLDAETTGLLDEKTIVVLNKTDLAQGRNIPKILEKRVVIPLSAKTGYGLDALLLIVSQKVHDFFAAGEGKPTLTRERHREALQRCAQYIGRALEAPLPEMCAEDLRLALRELGRITGRVAVEDLLDVVFRDFCIGK